MKTFLSVLKSIGRAPLKSVLTLLTVGLGVGVLIVAVSISFSFSKLMEHQLQHEGIVVMIANAEFSDEGRLEPTRPPQFDENVLSLLKTDVQGVCNVSPLMRPWWNIFLIDDTVYRIRRQAGVDEEYADIMGLKFIAGNFFTREDVESGAKKAVISESLAKTLFGTAEASLGQILKPPALPALSAQQNQNQQSAARRRIFTMPMYTVSGVFADPGELKRKSYGVGDMIIPYTAALPQGVNIEMVKRFLFSSIILKVQGASLSTVEAQVRDSLVRQYGDEVKIEVWEGTPEGNSADLEDARRTVATFSLVVNLLGFVLLVTGSIGILSIMLVEVLGRSREIALERALGASRSVITKEFFFRSLIFSGASAVVGVILGLILGGPLRTVVLPIFSNITASDLPGRIVTLPAIGVGVLSALLVGGVLGVFPVFSALRTNIAEGIREA